MKQDCESNEGVMAVLRNGEGNMGTRRHYVCQLSFLFQERRYISSH